MNKSFILYQEYKKHISLLSLEQKGKLFEAIFEYNEGKEIELDPVTKMAFSFIKADIDRNKDKYNKICDRNKKNIAKRWNTKNTSGKSGIPKHTKNTDNDNDDDDDDDDDDDKKNLNTYASNFELFWKEYPIRNGRRVGKKATYVRWEKLSDTDKSLLLTATDNYANSRLAKNNFAKDPERFLKNDHWRDYLTEDETEKRDQEFWDKLNKKYNLDKEI